MRLLIILLLTIHTLNSNGQFLLDSTILDTTVIYTGLDIPWELKYGPDDHLWVNERFGRIQRIDPVSKQGTEVLDLTSGIWATFEAGLLGMEFHPEFPDSPHVYIIYSYGTSVPHYMKVERYSFDGKVLGMPKTIFDSIPSDINHNGSRIITATDRKLYISVGDIMDQTLPQNLQSYNGKVLRINLDGSIPDDNPYPGSPVWSYGHRNSQGLVIGPDKRLFSTEHGAASDDEFQIIRKGGNYGWPNIEGYCDELPEMPFCNQPANEYPIYNWTPTIAPSDLIFYDHPAIPELENRFIISTLKTKMLVALKTSKGNQPQVIDERKYLQDGLGRIRDICYSPDGRIYLALNGQTYFNAFPFTHKIIELKNSDFENCEPPIGLEVDPLSFSSVRLKWNNSMDAMSYLIKGKQLGGKWIYVNSATNNFQANAMQPDETYIWKVASLCGNDTNYSKPDTFQIDKMIECKPPGNIWTSGISGSEAILNWTSADFVHTYRVYGQVSGSPNVIKLYFPKQVTFYQAKSLSQGSSYSWAVQSICNINPPIFSSLSAISTFTTASNHDKIAYSPEIEITIYDLNGRKLSDLYVFERSEIPGILDRFSAGIYILSLKINGNTEIMKYLNR